VIALIALMITIIVEQAAMIMNGEEINTGKEIYLTHSEGHVENLDRRREER
jgi:hypothetical protein